MKTVEQQGLQSIQRSRYLLIQGALAYVYRMMEPRTSKDRWLKDLVRPAILRHHYVTPVTTILETLVVRAPLKKAHL